jgi:hypothetical protein
MENNFDRQLEKDHRVEATRKRILSDFEELKEDNSLARTATTSTNTSVETVESVKASIDSIMLEEHVVEINDAVQMTTLFGVGTNNIGRVYQHSLSI